MWLMHEREILLVFCRALRDICYFFLILFELPKISLRFEVASVGSANMSMFRTKFWMIHNIYMYYCTINSCRHVSPQLVMIHINSDLVFSYTRSTSVALVIVVNLICVKFHWTMSIRCLSRLFSMIKYGTIHPNIHHFFQFNSARKYCLLAKKSGPNILPYCRSKHTLFWRRNSVLTYFWADFCLNLLFHHY